MRSIRVSEEVWQAIASRGKFGQTEDDVLRTVFELPTNSTNPEFLSDTAEKKNIYRTPSGHRRSFAKRRMSSYISNNQLHIEFQGGASSSWTLPDRTDKAGIRVALNKAITFAKTNEASFGQIMAVRKTLTNERYYLSK
jgi:hypothetical protein